MITKDDFVAWLDNPVTQAVFDEVGRRRDEFKEILSISAGVNGLQDRLLVGKIDAFNDLLRVTFEEIEEDA